MGFGVEGLKGSGLEVEGLGLRFFDLWSRMEVPGTMTRAEGLGYHGESGTTLSL